MKRKSFAAIILIFSLFNCIWAEDFFFETTLYAIKGDCNLENAEDFYYPSQIDFIFNRNVFFEGKFIPLLEKLFPQKKNFLDCYGFYIPEDDSADWVDELLLEIEEEKIAEALAELEENKSESLYKPEEDYDSLVEMNYYNSSSDLFYQEYGSEIFMPKKVDEGKSVIMICNSSEIKRFFYDNLYRVEKKEYWTNSEEVKKVKTEDYEYEEDSLKPVSLVVTDKDTRKRYFYGENGLPYQLKTYKLQDNKYLLDSNTIYVYDDENRLLKEEEKSYIYKNSKITDTFVRKHLYIYNYEEIPADEDYFEDDVLKMRLRHSSVKGTYTQSIFFDSNFSVKTYYEDDIKIREEFFTDGKSRVKEYEKR